MAQQEIKIALCGAGNVGGAVLELLTVNADFYKKMFDTDFLVTDVVTKSGKLRGYKDKFNGNIHTDFESIINNDSIAVYSFALKPEEHQPSGTCNFSRIDNATLQLVVSAAAIGTASTAKVRVYATNYNVLRVMSGMGGLAYSN